MKNVIKIMAAVAISLSAASCEKFLTADPISEISASNFFATENDLTLYCNGIMNSYTPTAEEIGTGDDMYSDLSSSKTSADYNRPGVWGPSKQGGWTVASWKGIRTANILLDKLPNSKKNVSEAVYNHYEGVGRFWRAYLYYDKMTTFGDVPWVDHALDISETDILFADRTDREEVFHHMLEDINFACDNMQYKGYERVINKYVALAFKARMCLFEGTFRKYHSVNPSTGKAWTGAYESSNQILDECIAACNTLISDGVFSLTTGKPEEDKTGCFAQLWRNADLRSSKEAIWIREYDFDGLAKGHELTWRVNSGTYNQQSAPIKTYMHMFLKLDGTPIAPDGDKVSLNEEFNNRDYRLINTVNHPGWTYETSGGATRLKYAMMGSYTYSGYNWIKWSEEKEANYSSGKNNNDIPLLRYAEVLLNYAEAMAERGKMTSDVWGITIGQLRERAGVKSIYPGDAGYVVDTWLRDYFSGKCSDNTLLEIRRERACELMLEGLRINDLNRWKCGEFTSKRNTNNTCWQGIWVTPDEAKNGLVFNGETYVFPTDGSAAPTGKGFSISTSTADTNYTFSEGTYGYIQYNYKLFWDDYMYVHPIPDSALTMNTNMSQNKGWE